MWLPVLRAQPICGSFYSEPEWPAEALEAQRENDLELLKYVTEPHRRDGTRVLEWDTEQFLLLYKDKPVFEYYGKYQRPDQRHVMWSTTKSLINTLVGMAVKDKKLMLSDTVTKFLRNLPNFRKSPSIIY